MCVCVCVCEREREQQQQKQLNNNKKRESCFYFLKFDWLELDQVTQSAFKFDEQTELDPEEFLSGSELRFFPASILSLSLLINAFVVP